MSIGSIPCSATAARCAGSSRRWRIPPCTLGWSVLTRPSSISGKPVRSEMSLTAMRESRRSFAVPPVETSSTPREASLRAKSAMPVLSVTLRIARWILWDIAASDREVEGEFYRRRKVAASKAFSPRSHGGTENHSQVDKGSEAKSKSLPLRLRSGQALSRTKSETRTGYPQEFGIDERMDYVFARAVSFTLPSATSTEYSTRSHLYCFLISLVFFCTKELKLSS